MNVLNFTGNCGRDAEVRFTAGGDAITSFSVALSSGYGDKKVTTWLNCSMFGKRGEAVSAYIKKGSQVAVSGEFTARPYTTKEGAERLSLDVRVNDLTLLGGKDSSTNESVHDTRTSQKTVQPTKAAQTGNAGFDDFEDDLPF